MYTWGKTKISSAIDLSDIPEEVQAADIIDISAGMDHVVALSSDGELFVWGNDRLGQANFQMNSELNNALRQNKKVVRLEGL